jgi:AraC-like DNA-binding protein
MPTTIRRCRASDAGANLGDVDETAQGEQPQQHLGLRRCGPHPMLSDVVEDIWDWKLSDADVARSLTLKFPPSAFPMIIAQYGVPLNCDWQFGRQYRRRTKLRHAVVKMQSGIVTARPAGAIGIIVVRIKPESAARIIHAPVRQFMNQTIDLAALYKPRRVALLEQALSEAVDSASRVQLIENFLLRAMRPVRPRTLLALAASRLRFNPSLAISRLAAQLEVSERHLSRRFKAMFGTGPKQFARLVRVEKAVDARREGFQWTDVAHACGFSDQAHLIHDFHAITGAAPEDMFRASRGGSRFAARSICPLFNVFVS